jgi:hypothetical protein
MKEKEMKKMNAMVLAKLNYPIMISMKVIIKMVKDMVKAPTSKIKFFLNKQKFNIYKIIF